MGYDIKAEREEKERQAKRTAARQARIDRMNSMKGKLRIFDVLEKAKELFVNLTEKISQEYAKGREKSKSPLCRCKDCGREISKKAESCPGCGALLRRKKQNSGCGCGGCLVLCFIVFIFFAGIFGKMLSSFGSKPVLPSAPANNNTVALPAKPATFAPPPVITNPNQFQEVRTEKDVTGKWYEGGNLHKADLATWRKASYEDKLATAADLAFAAPFVKRVFYQSKNTDTVKPFAIFLVECIDKGTDGINTKYKIDELANACAILRGWDK